MSVFPQAEQSARLTAQSLTHSYEAKLQALTAHLQRDKEDALRTAAAEAERRVAQLQQRLDKEVADRMARGGPPCFAGGRGCNPP